MKKLLSMLCVFTLAFALLTGCAPATNAPSPSPSPESTATPTPSAAPEVETPASQPALTRVTALKGPTAMGLVKLMKDADAGETAGLSVQFNIVASVDEVTPKIVQGEVDIAAVPANLASVLYNNTEGAVQVLAINTLGVLYIVQSGDSIDSVQDLRGKTIYASGKGATPEYALNYILKENGIDPAKDVTLEWKSEHAECLSALMAQQDAIALLPQPFVTTAMQKSESIRVALDLNAEWDKLQADAEQPSALITGVVVARKEFVKSNPEAVDAFLDQYRESVAYVNGNVKDAAQLVGEYGIVTAEVAEQAIPACNITFVEGEEMKGKLSGYLKTLLEQNPKSVGGKLPADDFYFVR